MADQTQNYGLVKPTSNEYYDIEVQNQNMEIIDQQIKMANDNTNTKVGKGNDYRPNILINGDFQVWQRGNSQNVNGYGSDDRWLNGNLGSTKTHSKQSFTPGQSEVPNSPSYFSRTIVSSVAGANNFVQKVQQIEDVARFSGQTLTLSFWAKADANKKISIDFVQYFGIGGSPTVEPIGQNTFNLTTAWQKFTMTVTIPSIVGKSIGTVHYLRLRIWFDAGSTYNTVTGTLGQQSGTFDLAQMKLEYGDYATPFVSREYGEELAFCQRYYEQSGTCGTVVHSSYLFYSGTIEFKATKRIPPTISFSSYEGVPGVYSEYNTSTHVFIANRSIIANNIDKNGMFVGPNGSGIANTYGKFYWVADAEL